MSDHPHAVVLGIVHEEAGRTLSKEDFDLCMRIAKRALEAREDSRIKTRDVAGDLWDASINCDFEAFKQRVAIALAVPAKTNAQINAAIVAWFHYSKEYSNDDYQARMRAAFAAAGATPVCETCNGHGMIGGPSYSAPDEGGEPCPDCNAPVASNDKCVAKVRVTHEGYSMELSKYIAYALPEGTHELFAAPQAPQKDANRHVPDPRVLPGALTPPVRHVLSLMLWQTLPIANALRATGRHINRKTEDEQAAALHWLLGIALEHGENWEQEAARALHKLLSEKKGV